MLQEQTIILNDTMDVSYTASKVTFQRFLQICSNLSNWMFNVDHDGADNGQLDDNSVIILLI